MTLNHPYPELSRDVTRLAAELATWNAEVQRSMDDYAMRVNALCVTSGCPRLTDGSHGLCWTCRHRGAA